MWMNSNTNTGLLIWCQIFSPQASPGPAWYTWISLKRWLSWSEIWRINLPAVRINDQHTELRSDEPQCYCTLDKAVLVETCSKHVLHATLVWVNPPDLSLQPQMSWLLHILKHNLHLWGELSSSSLSARHRSLVCLNMRHRGCLAFVSERCLRVDDVCQCFYPSEHGCMLAAVDQCLRLLSQASLVLLRFNLQCIWSCSVWAPDMKSSSNLVCCGGECAAALLSDQMHVYTLFFYTFFREINLY